MSYYEQILEKILSDMRGFREVMNHRIPQSVGTPQSVGRDRFLAGMYPWDILELETRKNKHQFENDIKNLRDTIKLNKKYMDTRDKRWVVPVAQYRAHERVMQKDYSYLLE